MSLPQNSMSTVIADGDLDAQACEKYCVYQRGNSLFGLLASGVREVALRPQFVVIPNTDSLLAGVCHFRNELLPVLRLDEFETRAGGDDQSRQIVVVSSASGAWAILVDRVIGLLPLEVSICSDVGACHGWSAAVMGSASHDNQIVQVLDANALYRFADDVLKRHRQGEVTV